MPWASTALSTHAPAPYAAHTLNVPRPVRTCADDLRALDQVRSAPCAASALCDAVHPTVLPFRAARLLASPSPSALLLASPSAPLCSPPIPCYPATPLPPPPPPAPVPLSRVRKCSKIGRGWRICAHKMTVGGRSGRWRKREGRVARSAARTLERSTVHPGARRAGSCTIRGGIKEESLGDSCLMCLRANVRCSS